MMDFVDMMRLRGQAAENIYFAQRERELIDALHAHPERLHQSPPDLDCPLTDAGAQSDRAQD